MQTGAYNVYTTPAELYRNGSIISATSDFNIDQALPYIKSFSTPSRIEPTTTLMPVGAEPVGSCTGHFSFRPLEFKEGSLDRSINTYCKIKIGFHGGQVPILDLPQPVYDNSIVLERSSSGKDAKVKVKCRQSRLHRDRVGEAFINLDEVARQGNVREWYDVRRKNMVVGKVRLEVQFIPYGSVY